MPHKDPQNYVYKLEPNQKERSINGSDWVWESGDQFEVAPEDSPSLPQVRCGTSSQVSSALAQGWACPGQQGGLHHLNVDTNCPPGSEPSHSSQSLRGSRSVLCALPFHSHVPLPVPRGVCFPPAAPLRCPFLTAWNSPGYSIQLPMSLLYFIYAHCFPVRRS